MKNKFRSKMLSTFLRLLTLFSIMFVPSLLSAQSENDNCLIIYYSRTGNSKTVAETLHRNIKSDLLKITDTKDRSGTLGFCSAALDSMFDRYTEIEPVGYDLSPYSSVILISPIWNWKLSVATRTALKDYDFKNKNLLLFTTGNQPVDKYEGYGDDASFLKKYFRDYLRGKHRDMRRFVKNTGALITGHHHINTDKLTNDEITVLTLQHKEKILSKLMRPGHKYTHLKQQKKE